MHAYDEMWWSGGLKMKAFYLSHAC